MKAIKALVVDDSATIRKIIKNNLTRFSIQNCDEASDGKAAWRLVQANEYDIIFTDYNMPELNGLEFVRKMFEAGDKYSKIRIVAVSSVFSDELRNNFKEYGVKAFIAKPFSLEMFKDAIGSVLAEDDKPTENAALSIEDITKLFEDQTPQSSFDGKYLVLDFGKDKLTIDANAIAKAATIYSEVESEG